MTVDMLARNKILENERHREIVVAMRPSASLLYLDDVIIDEPAVPAQHHMIIVGDGRSSFKVSIRRGSSKGFDKKAARLSNSWGVWHRGRDGLVDLLPRKSRIDILAQDWLRDTEWDSSFRKIMQHPSFDKLCKTGMPALSYVISKIRDGDLHVHWFLIAKSTSGVDPVPPQSRGKLWEMARYWLDWYDRQVSDGQ